MTKSLFTLQLPWHVTQLIHNEYKKAATVILYYLNIVNLHKLDQQRPFNYYIE